MSTTKVIPNEYGGYTVIDTSADRVERDFAAERKADRIERKALLKELRWDDATIEEAQCYGFPKPTGFVMSGTVWVTREAVYSRLQIAKWRERFLAFSAKVR
jgi:hypothetical protein